MTEKSEVITKIDLGIYREHRGEYILLDMESPLTLANTGKWSAITHYVSSGLEVSHCKNINFQPVRIAAGMEEAGKALLLRFPNTGIAQTTILGPNQTLSDKAGYVSIFSLGPDVDGMAMESSHAGNDDIVNVALSLDGILDISEASNLSEAIIREFLGQKSTFVSSLKNTARLDRARSAIVDNPYTGILSEYYIKSISCEILAELFRCIDGNVKTDNLRGAKDREKILTACEILGANLHDPPSVEILAKNAGMSRSKFADVFRSVTGSTVFGWIVRKRLDIAMKLIQNGGITIKEISCSLGYAHPSAFTAAFRSHFGVSPSSFLVGARPEGLGSLRNS